MSHACVRVWMCACMHSCLGDVCKLCVNDVLWVLSRSRLRRVLIGFVTDETFLRTSC